MNGPHVDSAIIIGACPAGLIAACYLGRLRRTSVVLNPITEIIARWIQRGHNTLAFPACVRGEELLARFREQALCQVVQIREETGRLGFVKRSFY
jgi:thioredoxin reductase